MELIRNNSRITLLSIDGLGGIENPKYGESELEFARTPNLDILAAESETGMITHVGTGITPGSGPGHLALFGYDPTEHDIGRGILSALGVGHSPAKDEVFFRGNFAAQGPSGNIIDRRAGRIDTAANNKLCELLSSRIKEINGIQVKFITEKEHRFILILKGQGLSHRVTGTDPQATGVRKPSSKPAAGSTEKESEFTSSVVNELTNAIDKTLAGNDSPANTVLLRGASVLPAIQSLSERYLLDKCLCIATYPMYKGLARLVGMEIAGSPEEEDMHHLASTYKNNKDNYDFIFIHVKKADSYGEDGNFEKKVQVIDMVDKVLIPALTYGNFSDRVLCVTGDHSTPTVMAAHSWHPVPILIRSNYCRMSRSAKFNERECAKGPLGTFPAKNLMALLLAHARRIQKYGA